MSQSLFTSTVIFFLKSWSHQIIYSWILEWTSFIAFMLKSPKAITISNIRKLVNITMKLDFFFLFTGKLNACSQLSLKCSNIYIYSTKKNIQPISFVMVSHDPWQKWLLCSHFMYTGSEMHWVPFAIAVREHSARSTKRLCGFHIRKTCLNGNWDHSRHTVNYTPNFTQQILSAMLSHTTAPQRIYGCSPSFVYLAQR